MPNRCAVCGSIRARRTVNPPGEWIEYLHDERGLAEPVGQYVASFCNEHASEAIALKDAYQDGEADEAAVQEFLDRLDLEKLVDEG